MTAPIFVELCCGSAAVSLFLLGGQRPPSSYMGSKAAYAPSIASAMGIHSAQRFVLVDAGLWADVWAGLIDPVFRMAVVRAIGRWREDGEGLFDSLAAASPASGSPPWVAAFLALQSSCVGSKPIRFIGGKWRTSGYARLSPTTVQKGFRERLLRTSVAKRVNSLPGMQNVTVIKGDAGDVSPIDGAIVYIDPPYDRKTGYPDRLPRSRVLSIAKNWEREGARVAVSEAVPMDLLGWSIQRLQRGKGAGPRTFGPTDEWLTMSPRAGDRA